jgi:branched-chain amino acid transport system permease protein
MATVALGIVADNAVLFTFGKEPRGFNVFQGGIQLAGMQVSWLQIAIPAVGLALAAGLHFFSRRTRYGKAMLAVVQNPDAARLMGINVPLAITLAYAASTLFAGVAGIMIAPLFNVHSDMGTLFGLKAFAVAILGGITSAWGVMLAGLIFGLTEALITALLGSTYTQLLSFALVIVALALMPNGLFGHAEVKKV